MSELANKARISGMWIGVGAAIGAAMGAATHNMGVWVAAGVGAGLALTMFGGRLNKGS